MTTAPSGHRSELDGLRATAVLAVVLFHARVPGFSGGFVGVEVFFVISGYLIAGLIQRERAEGRFSIAAFCVRRVRRCRKRNRWRGRGRREAWSASSGRARFFAGRGPAAP